MNSLRLLRAAILGAAVLAPAVTALAQSAPDAMSGRTLPRAEAPMPSDGAVSEFREGSWRGGAGFGVLGSTPDGTAFTTNGHADYFVTDHLSIGPLMQVGLTDDLMQIGLSGQGKYWIPLPGTNGRGQAHLQSGLGVMHADVGPSDTAWLIPLGVGYDYRLDSGQNLSGTMLVNFTNLQNGSKETDVMPGFILGLEF